MWVGIKSWSQESPFAERRNYIFVTFISLSSIAQGLFSVRAVDFHRWCWVQQKRLSLKACRDKLACQSHLRGLLCVLRTCVSVIAPSRPAKITLMILFFPFRGDLMDKAVWGGTWECLTLSRSTRKISDSKIRNVSWAQEVAESKVQFQNGLYT